MRAPPHAGPLTTSRGRLRLVPITPSYLDDLVALDADPEVMRYISGGVPTTRERYVAELLPRMCAYHDQPFGFFAAHEIPSGDFAGWFHLRPSVADPAILELGYRLRRPLWNRGLAKEGSLALLRLAFDQLRQGAVDACALPENGASIAVMKSCGMQFVGTFRHPRLPVEVVRYLVTRAGFRALHREK